MGWLRDTFGRRGAEGGGTQAAPAVVAAPEAPAWKTRGNEALAAGNLAEAARCYEQGVLAQPADASLRLNLGFVLLEQGEFARAAECLQQALQLRRSGDDFVHDAQFLLGRARAAQGQLAEAALCFDAALRAKPDFAEALEEGIRTLHQLGRHAEAADRAQRLVELRPSAFARLLLATECSLCGRETEAEAIASEVCGAEPHNIDASLLRFGTLLKLGRPEDALAEAQRMLALTGPNAGALVNVSVALEKLGRLDEALAGLEQALQLAPGRRDVLVNHVSLLIALGRVPEAVTAARAALQLHPDDADLHWNLSIAHLLLGDFEQGWAESEWRARSTAFSGKLLELDEPRWQGEDLRGRTIFLYGEQGFGDNIQFVRFLPAVAQRADKVLLQVPQALEALVAPTLPPHCELLRQGARLPRIDFHCPLMSLPAVLGTRIDTIPADVPYLHADAQQVARWRERLPRDTLNVGIAWSGKPTHTNDHNRSMTLAQFRAVAAPGCTFVTLQPQLREADRATLAQWPQLRDLGREMRDFADTAALVEALDLVVSVDTGVAHLAGALGKPLWVLLPHVPDWRWLLEREDSPWYPGARLYRQDASRAWEPVLARVSEDLALRARTR